MLRRSTCSTKLSLKFPIKSSKSTWPCTQVESYSHKIFFFWQRKVKQYSEQTPHLCHSSISWTFQRHCSAAHFKIHYHNHDKINLFSSVSSLWRSEYITIFFTVVGFYVWESTQLINHVCHSPAAFCQCQQELPWIQKTLQNTLLAIETRCGAGTKCVFEFVCALLCL